jgi:hypothetical protein
VKAELYTRAGATARATGQSAQGLACQAARAPPEYGAEIVLEGRVRGLEQLSPRDHHDVETRTILRRSSATEKFPNQPFCSVPMHRIAQLLRGNDAQARGAGLVGGHEDGHEPAVNSLASVEDALELGPAANPPVAAEPVR